jgi:hypothetical protein
MVITQRVRKAKRGWGTEQRGLRRGPRRKERYESMGAQQNQDDSLADRASRRPLRHRVFLCLPLARVLRAQLLARMRTGVAFKLA